MKPFDSKTSPGFEKLEIVVNSLYNIRKNKVNNKLEFGVQLDIQKIYSALNELIGSIVNVIWDKKCALFSQNLSEEAAASALCAKKIQHLVQNEKNKIAKPIIIVSKRNESVIIVAIMTSQFQASDSSKNYPILYSIEPSTGKRDLLSSTQHKLFETYLTKGSKENGIDQIFEPNVKISLNTSSKCVCKDVQGNDAWLCIYYSLLLVYEGNDAFLSNNLAWLDVDINSIKTILMAYMPSLSNSLLQSKEKKIRKKNISLNKLSNVEQELTELFNERKSDLKSKLNSIKDSSIDQQINRLVNDEQRLKNANQKLTNEIAQIEQIIKQGESLLMSNKKGNTTEQRFQNFITGQERQALESKIRKKIEKSKQDIFVYNESERNKIFDQQVKKLEQDLDLIQKNIEQINNSIDQFNSKIANYNNSNLECNKCLKQLVVQLDTLNSQIKTNQNEQNQMKIIQSELNQINVDYYYNNLIDRLLKDDIQSDKNHISSLKKNLVDYKSSIEQVESSLKKIENSIETNNSKVSQLRVLIDSKNSSIPSLRSDASDINSTINELNDEYDSYNRWYSSWMYGSKKEEISNKISKQKDNLNRLNNQISSYQTDVQKYTNEINSLEIENTNFRKDKSDKQTNLNRTKQNQKQAIDILKTVKDQIVSNYMEMIKQKDKQKMDLNIAIGTNRKSQAEANESISRNKIEIERINKELERQILSLQINQCTKDDIIQKINQTKNKQKNTESIQNAFEQVKQPEKKKNFNNSFIESQIISDEQFKNLMNDELISMHTNGGYQTWKLLYRGSRDGFEASSFHKKCDSYSNTMTIMRTDNLSIFGGFTGCTWSSDTNEFKSDPYAFIFSIKNDSNKMSQIIKCSEEDNAIYCDKNFGPCFGNGDIKITNLCNSNRKNESTLGFTYGDHIFEYGSIESKTFLAGSQFFRLDEIEVFCKHFTPLSQNEIVNYISSTKKSKKTILKAYEMFHTIAINGMISLSSFIAYLVNKIKIFRNQDELNEMKNLFKFIFEQFDQDKSGLLEFNEFITCFCIFDIKKKSEIPALFLEFFFDYADKDQSQTLELHELNHLLDQFPIIFKNNPQIQNLKKCLLNKNNQSLAKSEFLNLLDENKKHNLNILDNTLLLENSLIHSVILNNSEQYNNLMKLSKFENQKWKLIYRASRDGFSAEDFHSKCDDHFNTLTLIKAKNCDLFGGYANRAWSSIDHYLDDELSFIFILKNQLNDSILMPNVGLFNNKQLGPCFGNDFLQISNFSNLNNHSRLNIDSSNCINNFQVENIEIFKKDYTDLSQEEINFFETQYQIKGTVLKKIFHLFQSLANNGLINIDKCLEFILMLNQNVKSNHIEFLNKIFLYFDEDKTGMLKFVDFLKCFSFFDNTNDSFFKLLFDIADKDKSNSLDEEEIREIFSTMPSDILKNDNALAIALKAVKKRNGFLNRDQFLELIYNIGYTDEDSVDDSFNSSNSSSSIENDDDVKSNATQ